MITDENLCRSRYLTIEFHGSRYMKFLIKDSAFYSFEWSQNNIPCKFACAIASKIRISIQNGLTSLNTFGDEKPPTFVLNEIVN